LSDLEFDPNKVTSDTTLQRKIYRSFVLCSIFLMKRTTYLHRLVSEIDWTFQSPLCWRDRLQIKGSIAQVPNTQMTATQNKIASSKYFAKFICDRDIHWFYTGYAFAIYQIRLYFLNVIYFNSGIFALIFLMVKSTAITRRTLPWRSGWNSSASITVGRIWDIKEWYMT
jgi:hypothetical protein